MARVRLQAVDGPSIEVISGPQKGSRIPLNSRVFNIGRGDDNDIVVRSESISRNHATLTRTPDGIVVRDNDSKNGVIVNGVRRAETLLVDGDRVHVGDFVFSFVAEAPLEQSLPQQSPMTPTDDRPNDLHSPKRRRGPGGNKRVLLYTGLILFLGAAYWLSKSDTPKPAPLVTSGQPTDKEPVPMGSVPVVGEPGIKRAEEELSKLDWSDSSVREAEQYFRKGARELSNQNYHRAIEAFQAALQIDKRHIASRKYLTWAVQEAEFEARKNRDIAIRYYESLQYQRAIHHFQEVVALMSHRPADPMVGQAEKYIQYSKRALEAADYFP